MRIGFVTDSTVDLPPEIVARYEISVVANIMVIDGKSLRDGVDITREEFYNRLPAMKTLPTTATAASGIYSNLYEERLSQGCDHVFSIHPPTSLSGIFNAASVAAEAFPGRVSVVDSGQISLGLGLQVLEAAKAAEAGQTVEDIQHMLEVFRPKARLVAMLDTLEYIHRSGRVSWAKARLGNLLRVKPFIELKEGTVNSLGEVRTRSKGLLRLRALLTEMGPLRALGIVHINAEDDARQFVAELDLNEQPMIVFVTSILGAHVGPNALGFAGIVR
jgi:DegV family protein with EDD domain